MLEDKKLTNAESLDDNDLDEVAGGISIRAFSNRGGHGRGGRGKVAAKEAKGTSDKSFKTGMDKTAKTAKQVLKTSAKEALKTVKVGEDKTVY